MTPRAGCGAGGGDAGRDDAVADVGRGQDVVYPADVGNAADAADVADAQRDPQPHGCADGVPCVGTATCDTSFDPAGVCLESCQEVDSRTMEQLECGGASTTCLQQRLREPGTCTTTCTPGATRTNCAPAQVCTEWLWQREQHPDAPAGCVWFCHSDDECAPGLHCDRAGHCRAEPVDLTLLPDGEPCDPSREPATGPSTQCRGECLDLGVAGVGVCLSWIDLHATTRCPDDPDRMWWPAGDYGDDLDYCAYRRCDTDCDCTAPFVCIHFQYDGDPGVPDSGVCTLPDPTLGQGTPCSGDAGADADADAAAPAPDAANDAAAKADAAAD